MIIFYNNFVQSRQYRDRESAL